MSWRGHLSWSEVGGCVRRALSYRHLRSGHWFHQLAAHFLHAHALHRRAGGEMTPVPDEERVARSDAVIRRACVGASVLGACAAGTSTAATVFTAETNGWA